MRLAAVLLTAFACMTASGASAAAHDSDLTGLKASCNEPLRWAARHDVDDARYAISSENRMIALLITDRVVAMQLSDRALRKVDRELREDEDDGEDNILAQAIKGAVKTTVRSMLNHSAECDLRDIAAADYVDGELVLTARNGDHLFANTNIDNEAVMTTFREAEARAFVRELRKRMARER